MIPRPPLRPAQEETGWLAAIRRARDWLDSAWANYVVELDSRRQRDAIYQPIGSAMQTAFEEVTAESRWRAMWAVVAALLHIGDFSGVGDWLMATAAVAVVAMILAGGGWLLWWCGRRLRIRWTGNRPRRTRRRHVKVEFYRGFEAVLARRGLVRAPAQTQREFAAAAGLHFAAVTGDSRLAALPGVVADAFYRVRYGRQPLDSLQAQTVEHAIAQLASAPKKAKGDAGRRG